MAEKSTFSSSVVVSACSVVSGAVRLREWQRARLPVLHALLESAETHAHRVGEAIQPSHPLPSPSPPALHLPLHQGLFQ